MRKCLAFSCTGLDRNVLQQEIYSFSSHKYSHSAATGVILIVKLVEQGLGDVDHKVPHSLKLRQHIKVIVDGEELVRSFLNLENALVTKSVPRLVDLVLGIVGIADVLKLTIHSKSHIRDHHSESLIDLADQQVDLAYSLIIEIKLVDTQAGKQTADVLTTVAKAL